MSQHPGYPGYPYGQAPPGYAQSGTMQPGVPPLQQAPWPMPPGSQAAIQPAGWPAFAQSPDVGWRRINASQPHIVVPTAPFISVKSMDMVKTYSGNAANVAYTDNLQFSSQPGIVAQLTAGVFTETDLAVGIDFLNTFTVEIVRTNGDKLMTTSGLGGAVFGTARWPRNIGPSGWMMDLGSALSITVVPLIDDLTITLNFLTVQVYGPASFQYAPPSPASVPT